MGMMDNQSIAPELEWSMDMDKDATTRMNNTRCCPQEEQEEEDERTQARATMSPVVALKTSTTKSRSKSPQQAALVEQLVAVVAKVEPPPCQPDIPVTATVAAAASSSNTCGSNVPVQSSRSVASTATSRGELIRQRAAKLRRQLSVDSGLDARGGGLERPRRGKKKPVSRGNSRDKGTSSSNNNRRRVKRSASMEDPPPAMPPMGRASSSGLEDENFRTTATMIPMIPTTTRASFNRHMMDGSLSSHTSSATRSSQDTATINNLQPRRPNKPLPALQDEEEEPPKGPH